MTAALLAAAAAQVDGQHPQSPVAAGGYAYQLHLLQGYAAGSKAHWPLMIFLYLWLLSHRLAIKDFR